MNRDYDYYREALRGYALPCAFVDLDVLDDHADSLAAMADGKTIRIDSRVLRCAPLLKRVMDKRPEFKGAVVPSAAEAVFLSLRGFDDLIIARPVWGEMDTSGVMDVLHLSKNVVCSVDCAAHAEHLNAVGQDFNTVVPVAVDIDVCPPFARGLMGRHRAGVTTASQAADLVAAIAEAPFLRMAGVLGHLPVAGRESWLANTGVGRALCSMMMPRLRAAAARRRGTFLDAVARGGGRAEFVTGCAPCGGPLGEADEPVTEWIGSGDLIDPAAVGPCGGGAVAPAAGVAVEVIRSVSKGGLECQRANGFPHQARQVLPVPADCQVTVDGALRVRRPVGATPSLPHGSPVVLLTNDTASLFEATNTVLLISDGRVVDEVPTYRGEGQCLPL